MQGDSGPKKSLVGDGDDDNTAEVDMSQLKDTYFLEVGFVFYVLALHTILLSLEILTYIFIIVFHIIIYILYPRSYIADNCPYT